MLLKVVAEAVVVLAVVGVSAGQLAPSSLLESALFVSLIDQSLALSIVKLNNIYIIGLLVFEIQ